MSSPAPNNGGFRQNALSLIALAVMAAEGVQLAAGGGNLATALAFFAVPALYLLYELARSVIPQLQRTSPRARIIGFAIVLVLLGVGLAAQTALSSRTPKLPQFLYYHDSSDDCSRLVRHVNYAHGDTVLGGSTIEVELPIFNCGKTNWISDRFLCRSDSMNSRENLFSKKDPVRIHITPAGSVTNVLVKLRVGNRDGTLRAAFKQCDGRGGWYFKGGDPITVILEARETNRGRP